MANPSFDQTSAASTRPLLAASMFSGRLAGAKVLLLPILASLAAYAQEPILPADLFVAGLGRLEDTSEIKELTANTFEFRQHFAYPTRSAQQLNFMSFCMASVIARQRGFNGWTMTMKPSDDLRPTERYLTVVLLNNADEVKHLPATTQWIGYRAYKLTWPMCSTIIDARYLWPEK